MYTLIEFDSIESTSTYLKQNYKHLPHLTIVRANYQYHGRGQFDRTWDANPNQNVLMSVLYKSITIDDIEPLKQMIIKQLLQFFSHYHIQATFKAPNDIYVLDKKICGILIETKTVKDEIEYVIIGIGINVNQQSFGAYKATSMANEQLKAYDVNEVFHRVVDTIKNHV